jgi:hypothetical protein
MERREPGLELGERPVGNASDRAQRMTGADALIGRERAEYVTTLLVGFTHAATPRRVSVSLDHGSILISLVRQFFCSTDQRANLHRRWKLSARLPPPRAVPRNCLCHSEFWFQDELETAGYERQATVRRA